jgi:hypothetical protein
LYASITVVFAKSIQPAFSVAKELKEIHSFSFKITRNTVPQPGLSWQEN